MHIGACSCKGGLDGSPCSHQAAVSKHFHIASLNSVPTLFPEKLANIALGDKAITNLSYYFSIHQKADEAVVKHTSEDIAHSLDETIAMENSFLLEPVTELTKDCTKVCLTNDSHNYKMISTFPNDQCSEQNTLEEDLTFILSDIRERIVKDTSRKMKSGVCKFCDQYERMTQQDFSSSGIASAFHKFGWVVGKTVRRM